MNNIEFVNKLKSVATDYKTLYVLGCFGAPMNDKNKKRYSSNYSYNAQADRKKMIESATADTFGFDCVCFIKGILWGWNGDQSKVYGGAGYAVNGVPDIGADTMITKCTDLSTDFSSIEIGEAVWMKGHIGVYIGGGLAVECTPKWKNGVQITAVGNIGNKAGYNTRTWTKHGKLPYITYSGKEIDDTANVKTYTVQKGDSLWSISASQLGDGSRYPEIKKLNGLTSDTIHAGQVLKIPVSESVSKPSEPVSESHYEKIGKAFETAMKDINGLESVKKLFDLIEG